MRFSIIVPVYNIKKYLVECMDSLLSQDFDNYEVLLIDDGSTDGSGELCDAYCGYKHVKVFHKPNGGLSDARNFGIQHARGEYLLFVDGDDWIESSSLSTFNSVIQKSVPDVLITRLVENYPEEQCGIEKDILFASYLFEAPLTKNRAIKWICNLSQNTWPAPKYVVAKQFIEENHLYFLKGKIHEDVDWTSNLCYCATSFIGCTLPWYHHRMNRRGSITSSITLKQFVDLFEIASIHYEQYAKTKDDLHKKVMNRIMKTVYSKLRKIKFLSNEDFNAVIEIVDTNQKLFSIVPQWKYKVFIAGYKLVGGKIALRLLGVI